MQYPGTQRRDFLMRLFTLTLIVGVAVMGSSFADDRDQQRGRHDELRGRDQSIQIHRSQPVAVPQVQQSQPVAVPQVQKIQPVVIPQVQQTQPIVRQTQELRQSVRPQRSEFRRPDVSRAQQFQRTVQPTIIQPSEQVHRDVSRFDGDRHREMSDRHGARHNHGYYNNNYYYYGGTTGTSTVYPVFGYPYLSVPYSTYYPRTYPNRYFICYTVDQADEDSVHITCPYGTGWYSTSPEYDTYQYRSAYRPEYVCPEYGADQFIEFGSSAEANDWWNQNCDEWIDNSDSEY